MQLISEAKQFLRANFKKGCKCPVCGQHVKEYKRKLNSGMAIFLIGLHKLHLRDRGEPTGFFNSYPIFKPKQFYQNKEVFEMMDIKVTSLDYSVMRHFGLIQPRIAEDGKKDSGYWQITALGEKFVWSTGTLHQVPKYVFLYNNKRIGVSDEKITIKEALGEKFDYQELMQNR